MSRGLVRNKLQFVTQDRQGIVSTARRALTRLTRGLALFAVANFAAMAVLPTIAQAHDIPSRITVNAFVKPEGDTLTALLRVPMEAFGEISFPLRGPGFIQISEADFAINDAARVYLTESFKFYEDGVELTEKSVAAVRVELPSDRSFTDFDTARANLLSEPLEDSVNLYWRQGVLDVMVTYPISDENANFSVDPLLGTLANETTTVLRFLVPGGAERLFNYTGNPGVVDLDPRWHQAALRFVGMGFEHILEGIDHLLFLFCLVIPLDHPDQRGVWTCAGCAVVSSFNRNAYRAVDCVHGIREHRRRAARAPLDSDLWIWTYPRVWFFIPIQRYATVCRRPSFLFAAGFQCWRRAGPAIYSASSHPAIEPAFLSVRA